MENTVNPEVRKHERKNIMSHNNGWIDNLYDMYSLEEMFYYFYCHDCIVNYTRMVLTPVNELLSNKLKKVLLLLLILIIFQNRQSFVELNSNCLN